ncbi:hypothetical protein TNCV_297781 [Trichonephila clavipes]|nr:hypothetical protein TNCV_297781 [Trichonephila clavipes]
MNGFSLTLVLRLLNNTTTLKYLKNLGGREPELGSDGSVLYEDNASAHMDLPVKQILTSKIITMMEHPPHSPDLTLCDMFPLQLNIIEREPILLQLKRFRQ